MQDLDKSDQQKPQVDDHVQSSAMGAVKPMPLHPMGGNIRMPVSAATPDAEPKAERIRPPQHTGHDIGPVAAEDVPNGDPYSTLPNVASERTPHEEVVKKNAQLKKTELADRVADKDDPLEAAPPMSNPPFPMTTPGLPAATGVGPVNAAVRKS